MAGSLLTREVFWALAVHVQFVPCPRKVHTQAKDRTRKAGGNVKGTDLGSDSLDLNSYFKLTS